MASKQEEFLDAFLKETEPTEQDLDQFLAETGGDSVPAPAAAPAPEAVKSNLFPTASQVEGSGLGATAKRVGLGALDFVAAGDRAGGTLRGYEMSDPDSYFLRPEVEAMKIDTTGEGGRGIAMMEAAARSGVPMASPINPSMINAAVEFGGRYLSSPLTYLPVVGQVLGAGKAGIKALRGAVVPGVKKTVADLSKINPALLEKAATAEGLADIQQGAKIAPGDLGQQIAEDALRINKAREDLAEGSRLTQQRQIQEIDDAAALEAQGVNARAVEQNQALNAQRASLAEESRAAQARQVEAELLSGREAATGARSGAISDIQPAVLGEEINATVAQAKKPIQEAWVAGDRASIGPVRESPAATVIKRVSDGTFRKKKVLTQELTSVLGEFKALSPKQGMRKISSGAEGALKHLVGLSENSGHTIDDLLNIRAELRRVQSGDNFRGNIFDTSTDGFAFSKAEIAMDKAINQSIAMAAPKEAKTMIALSKAKDRQYATAKNLLGDLSGTMGATKNTANVIGKVRAMGPKKAREFLQAAEANPALAPVVPKLRQALVDDLLLSSMESGQFSAAKMAKQWRDPKMQEIKKVWLDPATIKRIDGALELGVSKIDNPSAIPAPKKIPAPAKLGSAADRSEGFYSQLARSEIESPQKVGRSFDFAGKPDKFTAETRVKNIGGEASANKRAMEELRALDAINGSDYATQAEKVFESLQLGMDASGRLSSIPMSSTGRSGLGAHIGEIAGFFVGGPAGFLMGHGLGAVAGGAAGATIGRGIQGAAMYAQSPAGAVAAYKAMNKIMSLRFPKAAKIGRAIQKTTSAAAKARLTTLLASELESEIRKQGAASE